MANKAKQPNTEEATDLIEAPSEELLEDPSKVASELLKSLGAVCDKKGRVRINFKAEKNADPDKTVAAFSEFFKALSYLIDEGWLTADKQKGNKRLVFSGAFKINPDKVSAETEEFAE